MVRRNHRQVGLRSREWGTSAEVDSPEDNKVSVESKKSSMLPRSGRGVTPAKPTRRWGKPGCRAPETT